MKKVIFIVLVALLLINVTNQVRADAVSATLGGFAMGSKAWGASKSLIVPVLIRGGTAASKFAVGAFTPAGIGLVVGGVLHDYYKEDQTSFPLLKSWLNSLGIGVTAGSYSIAGTKITPVAGSQLETCVNEVLTQWAGAQQVLGAFSSSAEYNSAMAANGWGGSPILCAGSPSGNVYKFCFTEGGYSVSIGGWYGKNVYNYAPSSGTCPLAGSSGGLLGLYISGFGYVPPSQYVSEAFLSVIVQPNISTRLADALTNGTGAALSSARAASEEVYDWINKMIAGNSAVLEQAGSPTKTIREVVTDASKTATGTAPWADVTVPAAGTDVSTSVVTTNTNSEVINSSVDNTTVTNTGTSTEFTPVPYAPSSPLSAYLLETHDLKTRTEQFIDSVKASPMASFITGFAGAVPSGGSCEITVNGGQYGTHVFSFCDLSGVWLVLRAVLLCIAGYIGFRIVTKGGGG